MSVAVNMNRNPARCPKRLPLVVIAGPTAAAKSALALSLSRLMPITIVNADASQVYRDLRILSARPGPEEERQVPHRLFGHVDGATAYSAAQWSADARAAINRIRESWRIPVLVGGTGLYIRTLLEGIAPVPDIDPGVRHEVRSLPVSAAFEALASEDPDGARLVSPNDTTRVARALEVLRSTGRPLREWQAERIGGIGHSVRAIPIILLPPREWLFARCDARFDRMMAEGAQNEVATLMARNLNPSLPVMRAIGVREIAASIREPEQASEHLQSAKRATRQYAKRQYTWFRNQPPSDWLRVDTQPDFQFTEHLAIKLREMALTS